MDHPKQLAQQFKSLYFGNNVGQNLNDLLEGISWKDAVTSVHSLNSIAMLVFHMDYYVKAQIDVFEGRPLTARDKYSYDLPPIDNEEMWAEMKNEVFKRAEHYARLVGSMTEEQLWDDFWEEKYGNYYQNIHTILQHSYYHLGQIAVIKKMLSGK